MKAVEIVDLSFRHDARGIETLNKVSSNWIKAKSSRSLALMAPARARLLTASSAFCPAPAVSFA